MEPASLASIAAHRAIEPRKLAALVRGELDWIAMKALEKDRKRRYETPSALARDIERYLHDEPVQACPPSAAYRFRKFARRNRAVLIAGSAIVAALVLLVIGLAVSNRLIADERNQKAAALKEKEQALVAAKASEVIARANAERAEKQSVRAHDSFTRASQGISAVLARAAMGLGEWSEMPPTLRNRFSVEVAKYYESLLQDDSIDPDLQYEAAVGYRSIGALQTRTGDHPGAEKSFQRSIEILDRLATEYPSFRAYRKQLAWSHYNLGGSLYWQQRLPESRATTVRAVELYENLRRETQNADDYLSEVSHCYRLLSDNYNQAGDLKRAVDFLNRALDGLDALTATHPEPELNLERMGDLHRKLGLLYAQDHRIAESTAEFQIAAKLFEDAFSIKPTWQRLKYLLEMPQDVVPLAKAEDLYQKFFQSEAQRTDNSKSLEDVHDTAGHVYRILAYRLRVAGRFEESEQGFVKGANVFDKLINIEPDNERNWTFSVDSHFDVANLMLRGGRHVEAEVELRRTIELYEQQVAKFSAGRERKPERAASYKTLAWLLATSPVPQQRNPSDAVAFAAKAVDMQPNVGEYRSTLGAAQYRAGQWQPAIDALQKSMDLQHGGNAFDWFFLAMAYRQLDQNNDARTWYDKAVEWTQKNQPNNEELRRFRDEAAELLGIEI